MNFLSKIHFYFLLILLTLTYQVNSQPNKDILLEQDISEVVQELRFMYVLDQGLRNYVEVGSFTSMTSDSIPSKQTFVLNQDQKDILWNNFITPIDQIKTERFLQLIDKYGFPSLKRLKKMSQEKIDFNPVIIFIHSPFDNADVIISVIKQEFEAGNIDDSCDYGYLLWHFHGRSDFSYMLDNGYEMTKNEDGTFDLKRGNCD